ncbi:hypothetical protein ENBRE01_2179 [Enteropsectra breve]|nr:hypothetical protein ENBRE01_2179 [Enteropsectra breve]
MSSWKGIPRSFSSRQKKANTKCERGKSTTANEIKALFCLKEAKNIILRTLKLHGGLIRYKYKLKPLLIDHQKPGRIFFCKFNLDIGENWKNVYVTMRKSSFLVAQMSMSIIGQVLTHLSNFFRLKSITKNRLRYRVLFTIMGSHNHTSLMKI